MNRNPCLKTLKYIVQTERAIVAGFGLLIVVCVGVYLLSAVTIGTSLSKLLEGVFKCLGVGRATFGGWFGVFRA